ncbi:deoxyribose-phosphate aldolase [Legionella dresdenensis]|uniref:Deoxyribose-phosphate aldolase n=1 Tax=Legionella dresdenensis TaxID=450200 RepID=A0ABV8CE42_9GAMM
MNLEQEFAAFQQTFEKKPYTPERALALIDLTLLNNEASEAEIQALVDKANQHQVAAVCVYPKHLAYTNKLVSPKSVTVINFPDGSDPIADTVQAIEQLPVVDEIDYVFPYQAYANGIRKAALAHCTQALEASKKKKALFKVIIETGALPSDLIYPLCRELIKIGCDFIKTSTGKIPQGATPLAAFAILKALKDSASHCGIKISGGVKTTDEAYYYMAMAQQFLHRPLDKTWFRIGASSLIDDLAKS